MKQVTIIKTLFWSLICILVCSCSYFILHNAAWLLGDDCQTLIYTGWDKPIFGFFVSPTVGRFFPLDYTIYDVLCLFFDSQIPASAHYFIHVICFFLFMALALFYGRKIPNDIVVNQNSRVSTYEKVQTLIKEIGDDCLYFYEPDNPSMEPWELEIRSIRKFYLQTVVGWYMHNQDFSSEKKESFDGSIGFWQVVPEDEESFVLNCPDAECVVDFGENKVYRFK